MNAIDYDDEGKPETINSCIFQSGYFNQTEHLDQVRYWIDCGDALFTNDYEESNLPIPLAKARALEFLLNFFQKSTENESEPV